MRYLVLLVVLSGCSGPQVPGDGTLVVVEADPAFQTHFFTDQTGQRVRELQAVRQGVHYWNKVGANLRLPDEVSPAAAAQAIHFGMHRDDFSWPGEDIDGMDWYGLGYATVYPNSSPYVRSSVNTFAQVVAHELGHALGLGHIADSEQGIMAAKANWWDQKTLSPADIALFQKMWPSYAAPPSPPASPSIRCMADFSIPSFQVTLPGGHDAQDDCTIPDGGPGDTFQVGFHRADWTVTVAADRGRFAVGAQISAAEATQVDILYQGATGSCHEWTGTVTVTADGIQDGTGWGVKIDTACSTDSSIRLAGSLGGIVGPYY